MTDIEPHKQPVHMNDITFDVHLRDVSEHLRDIHITNRGVEFRDKTDRPIAIVDHTTERNGDHLIHISKPLD